MAGFTNPARYIFDDERMENGSLEVVHKIPYSVLVYLAEDMRKQRIANGEPLEFGHTLEDQIGGQTDAGWTIDGFYEDHYGGGDVDPLSRFLPTFIATRATTRTGS